MEIRDFIAMHGLSPESIDGEKSLALVAEKMEQGLAGRGNIPMIPSYLPLDIPAAAGRECCVLDAGGTNLRVAKARFTAEGQCGFDGYLKTYMPGTRGALSFGEFYGTLADFVRGTGCVDRVGLCFSYNVVIERNLDGILHSWCKEVRVPEAPGKPVGASLRRALGDGCESVCVLNDSTAALLGAHCCDPDVTLGLILGTGINICYPEACRNIPKVPSDLRMESMIISTEIGEFDGFPKSTFDGMVIRNSDEPAMAHAEKQCAGAYLGELISLAWQEAAREGLIAPAFAEPVDLPRISDYLAGEYGSLPQDPGAGEIAGTMLHRAAKIAAVLTAGAVLRSSVPGDTCRIVIEGSQYTKLTGFAELFRQELKALMQPRNIGFTIAQVENSCMIGAALAAFAEPV